MQIELFGKTQRFKRLYFDEAMMLKLNSFAREVSLQQDWGLGGVAVHQGLDDKADDGSFRTERV